MGSTDERVGTVHVRVEGASLRVRYELLPGFELVNAHLCVAANPFVWTAPGSCPWASDALPPGTREYEFVIPLSDVTNDWCGAVLSLQVHGTVRAGGSTEAGSAYAGSFRGQVQHTSSCDMPPPVDSGPGCRLTQGYWKNHPESWPVAALTIGTVEYDQDALLELLGTPPRGDASLVLGHQLIAAELNLATGGLLPEAPHAALAGARVWMTENSDIDGRLPYQIVEGQPAYEPGVRLSVTLDAFNNGEL
jgi:hypothetical protein